jgi:hypothetical protein
MQKKVAMVSVNPWWKQTARWLAFIGGVINPIAFALAITVAGFLRPGYSPIHQAISDLGVGANGSLLDTIAGISGLLLIAFGVAFALLMQRVLTGGWRLVGSALRCAVLSLTMVENSVFSPKRLTLLLDPDYSSFIIVSAVSLKPRGSLWPLMSSCSCSWSASCSLWHCFGLLSGSIVGLPPQGERPNALSSTVY